jgi:hypothetical protein
MRLGGVGNVPLASLLSPSLLGLETRRVSLTSDNVVNVTLQCTLRYEKRQTVWCCTGRDNDIQITKQLYTKTMVSYSMMQITKLL